MDIIRPQAQSTGNRGLSFGVRTRLAASASLAVFNKKRSDMVAAAEGFLSGTAFGRTQTIASFMFAATAGGLRGI